jgi:hypothetical protein
MQRPVPASSRRRRLTAALALLILVLGSAAVGLGQFSIPVAHADAPSWAPSSAPPLMAGDTLWNGVPSFIWGSNDTQIYDGDYSIITEPAIQQEAASDHLSLQRVWLFQIDLATNQPETDAYQQSKVQANLATGAKLLCELPTHNSMAYDEHMVTLFAGDCSFYEFMNEPDDEQISVDTYVNDWTSEIPVLRSIDPSARFGGPAAAAPQYNDCTYTQTDTVCYMQKVLQGMAANGVLPDFVTFHWYPCFYGTDDQCTALASSFGDETALVRGWMTQYFGAQGANIPVGITEWNADPAAPMNEYAQDPCGLENFSTVAVESAARAGISFMNQFDLADYGGYGTDDMVDIYQNGAIKPQYYAMLGVVNQIYPDGTLPTPTMAFTQPDSCPAPPPVWTPGGGGGGTPTGTPTSTPPPSSNNSCTTNSPALALCQSLTAQLTNNPAPAREVLNGVASGDLLTASIAIGGGHAYTVSSVTDSLGNTWIKGASGVNLNDNTDVEEWYTTSAAVGNDTLSIAVGGDTGNYQVLLTGAEFHGTATFESGVALYTNGADHSSGAIPGAVAGSLIVAATADGGYNTVWSIGDGKSQLGSNTTPSFYIEGDQSYGPGTSADFTSAASLSSMVAAMAFAPPPALSLAQAGTTTFYPGHNAPFAAISAFGGAVASGDLLVAAIAVGGGHDYVVSSVTDLLGNTWTRAKSFVNLDDETDLEIWYTTSGAAGADSVTATIAGDSGFVQAISTISEFSGSASFDGAAAAYTTGTSHSSGAISGASSTSRVVALIADGGDQLTFAINDGKSQLGSNTSPNLDMEGNQSYGSGTSASFSTSASKGMVVVAAAFS